MGGLQSAMSASGRGMLPREIVTRAMMSDPEFANWYNTDPEFKRRCDVLTTGFPDMMQFQSWVQDTKIKRLLKHAGLNFDAGESPAGGPAEPEPEKKKEPTPEPEPELSPEEQEKKDKKDKADEI